MNAARNDRAAGVLVGLAAGDALGAGYEFGPAFDGPVGMIGGGPFGWAPGEWTDDTQMALCIANQAATGEFDLDALGDRFIAWADEARDIGIQTRAVLSGAGSGRDLTAAAADYHRRHPDNSAGNGSLMRTGPVALLGTDEGPAAIAERAAAISALTHADPLAVDACVLWTLAVASAVETGELPDLKAGLEHLPEDRRDRWAGIIDEAEREPPGTFTPNGFVVRAFQAAWSSIVHTPIPKDQPARRLRSTLENAVRIGNDTDTVAAIAGTLLGARWGSSAVPLEWKASMHGWPEHTTTRDLVRLAVVTYAGNDDTGWPSRTDMLPYYREMMLQDPLAVPLPSDEGVLIGNVFGIDEAGADVIVSLCRMGSEALDPAHHDVWLLDFTHPQANPNLAFVVEDTVRFIETQREAGNTVFVHCVQAQSRTPLVGAAYLAHTSGTSGPEALRSVEQALPGAHANTAFRAYLEGIPAS